MRLITISICLAVIMLSGCAITPTQEGEPSSSETWVSIFNGVDLDDWIVKIRGYALDDNYGETFRIVDSLLTTSYEAYNTFNERFGHIYYKTPYSHYRIRIVYRFIGDQAKGGPGWAVRNSGIMLHCQDPATIGLNQDFPISIEAQLLGGNGTDERTTMNLCTPGTHVYLGDTLFTTHCITSNSETYHGDQWVTAEALVLGDSLIVHYVEGKEVLRYTRPQIGGAVVNDFNPEAKKDGEPLTEGYISLQSESHPIQFKSVEILNLCGCTDPKADNYRNYYVKSDNSLCQYSK